MPTAASITAFAVASLALIAIPGPAVLYIVNRSVSDGRRVGLAAVAGIEIGSLVHVLAASVGLSAILAASSAAFQTVKWLGVAYLVIVGVRTLARPPAPIDPAAPSTSRRRAFTQGVVVNVLNPKVALFFVSFLPQFTDASRGSVGAQALLLGCIFVGIACITDGAYSLLASGLRAALIGGRTMPFVRRYVSGTMFIGLGLAAATASAGGAVSTAPPRT